MLAFIGFTTIALIMYFLLKGKALPITTFVLLPIVAAVVAGFGFQEIIDFMGKGVGTTWSTAVLFIFSIAYFSLMSDAGMFDKLVDKLVKISGSNITMLMLTTGIIAVIGHLDGSATTTYLITIPTMLPIYKRLQVRPTILLLLCGAATGVMNLVPWGGPTARVSSVTGIDGSLLWRAMIPMQVLGLLAVFALAVYFGGVEKKRLAREGVVLGSDFAGAVDAALSKEGEGLKRPKLLAFNLLLTLGVLVVLCTIKVPAYLVFLVAFVIAMMVNYPDTKLQTNRIQTYGASAIPLSATLIGAGIFLGVFVNSGMIEAMSGVLIGLIPGSMQQYLHIIVGALGAPIGMTMGPDPYYYGIMPLVGNVVAQFGVPLEQVGYAMLIGENAALAVSPAIPVTFLAIGLAGVELKEHIKFSFLWLWGISLVMLAFAVVTGLI